MVLHSRGCGRVARRRILSLDLLVESLTGFPEGPFFVFPLGVPVGRKAPETPFFCFVVPAHRPEPASRGCREAFPVPGRLGPFRVSKGIFVIPQRLLVNRYFFRNVLLTRYMIRFAEYGLWNGIGKDGNDVPEHRSAACTM